MEPHVTIFYLFAGQEISADHPKGKPHSFTAECAALNATVKAFDTLIDKFNHDLIQPEIWNNVREDMIKTADGGLFSPPCGSFCSARDPNDGGPRPLRAATGPELYGLPNLWPEEQESVRVGTACIVRTAEAAQLLLDKGSVIGPDGKNVWIPWLFEQPMPKPDEPHGMKLNEVAPLDQHEAVANYDIAQCPLGARNTKMTRLKGTVCVSAEDKCPHPKQWWRIPWSGE